MEINKKLWTIADYPHIRIPKKILYDQQYHMLSPEAIIVYGTMMDRTNLSFKNRDKFANSQNELFIYFPQHEIMSLLNCGHDKATKILKELIDANLIKVRRHGIGRPYEIVVTPIDWRLVHKNINEQPKKPLQDFDKSDYSLCGKNDRNNTDINNFESNNSELFFRNSLISGIEYDELICKYDPAVINRILDVAVNTLSQEAETFLVKDKLVPSECVKGKLRNLSKEQVLYVTRTIKNATYTTDHSDAFILNALFES